jgi:hypothetical protein
MFQSVERQRFMQLVSAMALPVMVLAMSGCGAGAGYTPAATTATGAAKSYNGTVFGGQQPVSGATVTLYGVSTGGDGAAATSLMKSGVTVTTDANGGFVLTGQYTCPSAATYTYVLAQGGNPGLTAGTNNTAITMMTPLGLCSGLSSSTFVAINELTTVGAVAALYPYMGSYKAVGSANSDAALLATAMGMVNQYVNTGTGVTPGPSLPTGSTVPTTMLTTLADAISACINSTGGTSGQNNGCGNLFKAATPSGGSAPTETIGALIDIFNNPTNNAGSIFNVVPTVPPFQPTLGTAPVSWAMPITAGTTQQVEFSSSVYSVNEGAGTVTLSVNRINGSTGAVSVNYATADGTNTAGTTPGNALNGLTYTAANGTLSWAAGDTSTKTVTVPIIDVGDSSNGTILFTVGLSGASGASLGVWSKATVTIKNNDAATAAFIMNANLYSVNENAGSVTVAIKRQNTLTGNATVSYTTTGLPIGTSGWGGGTNTMISAVGGTACSGATGPDYVTASGTQSWTASTSSPQTVPAITICDRGLTDGGTRSFLFQITTMTNGVALGESTYAVVTITDNDSNPGTIAMASATAGVNENAGVAEVLVNRVGGSTGAVTATYATADGTAIAGTDYTAVTGGTLSWAAGDQSSRIIAVPITDENLSTGTKTFSVSLTGIASGSATLGATTATLVTISDNDSAPGTIALSSGTYSVSEAVGTATFSVLRTGGSSGSVSVNYTTQDGTAAAGTDYTAASGTLTWAAGDATAKTISVPLVDEKLTSGSKTFNVVLSSVSGTIFGAPSSALVTINDNDVATTAGTVQFSAASYATTESSGTVTVSATRTGGTTGAVSAAYATSDYSAKAGTDYTANSGTLSWASGDSSTKTFTVSVNDVKLYSGTRTFYVAMSAPAGGAVVGTNAAVPVVISESDPIAYPTSDAFANSVDVSYSNITDPVTNKAVTYTWGQFPANDYGPDPVVYNTNPTDPNYVLTPLSALPAAGVHPRLLFTAADLPAIQCRLTGNNCTGSNTITVSGQLLYKKLQEYDAGLKGTYSDTAAYTIPDYLNGGYEGSHGNTFIRDYKDPGSLFYPANKVYDDLAKGVQPTILSTGQPANTTTMWSLFAYEALYCLINNDTAGMQKLLSAATFELTNEQAARIAANTATPYVATAGGGDAGFYFGYIYDWAYNAMTPAQVTQWTNELVNTTWAADNYGTLNMASANRSNWATFTYRTPQLLDIQGQTGYNDIKAAGLQRGLQNFMTYGIFPSGAFIEGEAKDQLGAESLTMLGRLGGANGFQNLFQHPNLQAYVMKFLPGSVIPNPAWVDPGGSFPSGPFVRYDLLGGTEFLNNNDPVTLHYMFPNNAVVDWLYQLQQGPSYQFMTQGVASTVTGSGVYYDDFLTSVAYMTDFNPANTATSLNLPVTYFSGERALMMTRSDWSTNAMMLNMHTREFNGGHPMADRNAIYIFGKGRGWSAINQWNFENNAQSIVNIDAPASKTTPIGGLTSPPVQGVTTPGRMVDFQDQPYATFSVGDASYCWDYVDTTAGTGYTPAEIAAGGFKVPTGSILEPHSKNAFAYTKLVSDEMNTPVSSLPSWIDYNGLITPTTRAPLFATPIVKAFRTAGLVRGPSSGVTPYGLVVDDIQVSATVAHHYDWQLLLVNDLQIMNLSTLQSSEGVYDITLAANGVANPGDPVLLIRVLDMNTTCTISPCTPYILPVSSTNARADSYRPELVIPSDSLSPNYKVLIFPYILGDTLPTTTWNAAHTAVTVTMPTYTDTITFSAAASGKTDVHIMRGGATILNMNTPIAPFQ